MYECVLEDVTNVFHVTLSGEYSYMKRRELPYEPSSVKLSRKEKYGLALQIASAEVVNRTDGVTDDCPCRGPTIKHRSPKSNNRPILFHAVDIDLSIFLCHDLHICFFCCNFAGDWFVNDDAKVLLFPDIYKLGSCTIHVFDYLQ